MNDLEIRTLDTLKRVRSFDATHTGIFTAGTLARELFDAIADCAGEIEAHSAVESSGRGASRQGTSGKAAARAALLEDLRVIRRTARSISAVMNGIDEQFRIPRNANDQQLLDTARAFLANAEPLKTEFLRREVPESVFQELAANLAAFESALNTQYAGRAESVTAAASIDAAFERGTDALRQLDPIVRNKLHNDPAALAAWEAAKRTERAAHRSNPRTPPASPAPKQ